MALARLSEKRMAEDMRVMLTHLGGALNIPLNVKLWNGTSVPLGQGEGKLPSLSIRDRGVVASLLKKPTLENLVRHYAVGNLALHDGELLDVAQSLRERVKKKQLKEIDKKHLLKLLWPYMLVKGRKAVVQNDFREDAAGAAHKNEHNKNYIQFHYDVGNEFYKLFLDPEMQYSCAYFRDAEGSLAQAQQDKLEMICRKLRLQEGDRFLDIGCGWGGLICYAAKHYGVKAHGVTLSQEQYDYTREKIRALGLEDRVSVEIRDYLTLEGTYDKIASIGMFEHIGLANFPAYFKKIRSLLRDRGIVLNHGIARRGKADRRKALTHITPEKRMILKYIFPGSELAPIGHSVNAMEAAGLEIHDVEGWREHYALTCRHWCERLSANKDKAVSMVGLERYNLWVAYLAGVSLGFASGSILIFQTVATKRAKDKGASGLPLTREDLYRK